MKGPSRRITTLVALTILLISDVTMGLDLGPNEDDLSPHSASSVGLGSPFAPIPDPVDPGDLGGVAEGGGPLMLFADDMTSRTAEHYAAMGLPEYYGGAIPAPGEGAERWRHEWYQWGTEAVRGTGTWGHADGLHAWRFGDGTGQGDEYPAGVLSELVSPIIDLRDVVWAEASGGTTIGSVDNNCPSSPQICGQVDAVVGGPQQQARDLIASQSDARFHVQEAAAALRLQHAYGFDEMLRDGGRVEAAYLDPHTGWSEWLPLAPEFGMLRIGDQEIRGRAGNGQDAGIGFEVHRDDPSAEATLQQNALVTFDANGTASNEIGVAVDEDGVTSSVQRAQNRHLYQGNIEASKSDTGRGPWVGFGGDSGGSVDSVFNLTAFAGHIMRLRFVTATAESTIPGVAAHPGPGWLLNELEVHGLGTPGVRILGLTTPGDGTVIAPDRDFHPTIAVQNTLQDPLPIQLRVDVGPGQTASAKTTIETGPFGRAFLSAEDSFHSLVGAGPEGRYTLDAWVNGQRESSDPVSHQTGPEPFSSLDQDRFHIVAGTGLGSETSPSWDVLGVSFKPDEESLRPFFVERGRTGQVHVTLRNLAAVPQELDLTGDAAALQPLLVDETLQPVGELTPDRETVLLDVTRDVSGTLGVPGAETTISYQWGGSLNAGPLRLLVEDADGDVLLEGRGVLVDAALPPMISEDFGNLWRFGECSRAVDFEGQRGVLQCSATNDGAGTEPPSPGPETAFSLAPPEEELYLRLTDSDPVIRATRDMCESLAANGDADAEVKAALDAIGPCEGLGDLEVRVRLAAASDAAGSQNEAFSERLLSDAPDHERPGTMVLPDGTVSAEFVAPPLSKTTHLDATGEDPTQTNPVRARLHVQADADAPLAAARDGCQEAETTVVDPGSPVPRIVNPDPIGEDTWEDVDDALVQCEELEAHAVIAARIEVLDGTGTAPISHWAEVPLTSGGHVQDVDLEMMLLDDAQSLPGSVRIDSAGDMVLDPGTVLLLRVESRGDAPMRMFLDHEDYPAAVVLPVSDRNLPTIASFEADLPAGVDPHTVTFAGTVEAGDHPLVAVELDLGDGSPVLDLIDDELLEEDGSFEVEHTYGNGEHTATLTIIDEDDLEAVKEIMIEVLEPQHAVSPAHHIALADLSETSTTRLTLVHRGAAGTVLVRSLPADGTMQIPDDDPEDWDMVDESSFPAAQQWTKTVLDIPLDPRPQWVLLDFVADEGPWALSTYRYQVGDKLLGSSDFTAQLRPDDGDLTASGSSGFAHLDVGVPGLDAVLQLPGPIPLVGVRPTLEFRHWLDTGDRGVAIVEVAPAHPVSTPLDEGPNVAQPALPPGGEPPWEEVATFEGAFTDSALRPVQLDLSPYLDWEEIQVRLRYQELVANQGERKEVEGGGDLVVSAGTGAGAALGLGWFVEEVTLSDTQPQGDVILHEASPGFEGYGRSNVETSEQGSGRPLGASVGSDSLHIDYLPDAPWQCANTQRLNAYSVGPVAITDPIDLRSTFNPFLVLEHEFLHAPDAWDGEPSSVTRQESLFSRYIFDVEFQAQRSDGSWPDQWIRATPNDPAHFNASSALDVDPRTGEPGVKGPGGVPPTMPFADHNMERAIENHVFGQPWLPVPFTSEFNIGEDSRIAGQVVRFRTHLWQEYNTQWGAQSGPVLSQDCTRPSQKPTWNILGIDVRERRHFSDVAVQPMSFDVQDASRIDQLDPTAGAVLGLDGVSLLSNDAAAILRVPVSNEGIIDQDVQIRLTQERVTDSGANDASDVLSFRFLAKNGDILVPGRSDEPGIIRDLAPGEVREALFRIDASGAPPGRYRFTVDAEPLTARDTNPDNDRAEIVAEITPFRAITLDAARSQVSPFVATDDAQRQVKVTLRNEGNVDEKDLRLSAQLVELLGVPGLEGSFEAVEGVGPLTETDILTGRRTGEHEFTRVIDTEGLGLEAGKRYAVKVQYDVGDKSVDPWWEGDDVPTMFEGVRPEDVGDSGLRQDQILDISRDLGLCDCMLLPFRVEESLFSQSYSASDASRFPDAFPADAEWTPQTFWNGDPVDADDPLGLPQWQQVAAGDVEGVTGIPASGQVWQLPAYDGVDDLEHTLESPVLPAHVVQATSRAFLDMRYASDLVDGQAVLEARDMERGADGEWRPARGVGGEWRPIDEVRTQRVAVILPPDYPQVIANANPSPYATGAGGPNIPCYRDFNNDGEFHPTAGNERVYLTGSSTFATPPGGTLDGKTFRLVANDVRLAKVPTNVALGSFVQPSDQELSGSTPWTCTQFEGGFAYHDIDGDGLFGTDDILYIDGDASGDITVGDIIVSGTDAGTVVTGAAATEDPLIAASGIVNRDLAASGGAMRVYFDDPAGIGEGSGVVSAGDVRLSVPDFGSVVAATDEDHLNPLAQRTPVPPFYQQDATNAYEWRAQECIDAVSQKFCHWSPFPQFPAAGNPEWHMALNDTLTRLSAAFGAENVGLFTTITEDLLIGHDTTEAGPVYNVPRPGAEDLTFPIRSLDALYLDLADYGAVALMGDGLTRTFAEQSRSLLRMSHGGVGPADQEPDQVYVDHFLKTFAILREAGDAGVSVIAAIGPAPATVAASGAAPQGLPLTMWQQPNIPEVLHPDRNPGGPARIRCTAIDLVGTATGEAKHRTVMTTAERDRQTKVFCKHTSNSGGQSFTSVDSNQLRNYYFYASEDAQSLGLRDLMERTGGQFSHTIERSYNFANSPPDRCDPPVHPMADSGGFSWTCIQPSPLMASSHGPTTFITAPYASNNAMWVQAIIGNLTATGALPAGSGSWQHLPTRLSAPFGGTLDQDDEGNQLFRGEPVQFRIRIQSDPALGGHGTFAVDSIELLGTPNERDVGVRFVEPRNEVNYAPGGPFATLITVTNRGTEPATGVHVDFTVEQVGFCDGPGSPPGECIPEIDSCPGSQGLATTFDVGELLPGEVRVIRSNAVCPIGSLGRFPDKGSHPADAAPPSRWAFRAALEIPEGFGDVDPTNDAQRVVALGQKVVDVPVTTVRLEPNAAPAATDVETVQVHIEAHNQGTQTDPLFVELSLHPVRLDGCRAPPSRAIVACYPPGHPSAGERPDGPLLQAETLLIVPRHDSATGVIELPIDEAEIPPGTYRVDVQASVGGVLQSTPGPQWLHLVDPALDPDEAKPYDAADLSPLAGASVGLPTQSQPNPVFMPGGFSTDNGGGACQPDSMTTPPGSPPGPPSNGAPMVHGWWVTDQAGHACGTPRQYLAFQWMRDPRPTFNHGDPPQYGTEEQCDPDPNTRCNAEAKGDGDFGPDILYWHPRDERTNGVRSTEPVFTLATMQDPVLRLDARYVLTPGTAVVVEAQPALRTCTGGNPQQARSCSWTWPGASNWFTLSSTETRAAAMTMAETTGLVQNPVSNSLNTFYRQTNTNPLAGTTGIWGGDTLSAGGDGWKVIEYDLSGFQAWCDDLVSHTGQFSPNGFSRITEGCRFADSDGGFSGADIPVPIRFRIQAVSYGGDAGVNFFEVRDLAITSHHVQFAGAGVRSPIILDQPDASTAPRLPLRIENTGPIHETLRVSIQDAPGTTLFPGIDLQIGPTSAGPFDEELVVEVPAHSAKVVWVRPHVAIELAESFAPGRDHPMPFVVRAESVLGDPTLRPEVLFDAKMRTRNWADLETDCFFIGEDDRCGAVFPAEREVPVPITVPVTNRGRLDIDQPILVRLYEEEISLASSTGEPTVLQRRVARDATGAPSEALIESPIESNKKRTELVDLEWNPPELGLYRLVAEVNLPHQGDGLDPIPETRLDNNVQSRFVAVGRVSLSDLHIEDARLVEFGTGETVERAVEGHNYRVVATVSNHGNAPALGPTLEFRIGSASPFSFWNALTFPGDGATMEVQSSVWTAVGRQDGTPQRFLLGITTQSPSASVDGKDLEFVMPVDRYGWRAEDPGGDILLLPGTRTVLSYNVTNTGTAAGTPVITSSHDGLQTDMLAMPPVDPGETARVDVAVTTPPGFETDGSPLALTLSAREDPRRSLRLPGDLLVLDLGDPTGHAFPVLAEPGPVDATLVFDNPANIATTWTLDNASAPLLVQEGALAVPVAAFDRVVENVTLLIGPHAAPGRHDATLRFLVGPQGNASARMAVSVDATLDVLPRPLLEATVEEPDPVRHGEPARVLVRLFNAGNVPVEARLDHTVDRGGLEVQDEGPFRIAPGHDRTVAVDLTEGKNTRVLGRSVVTWNGTGDPARLIDLPWEAAFLGNNVRIVETDLDTLKVTADAIHRVRATVENPADQAVRAEVLVVVDGLLHDRTVLELAPGASKQAVLPFQAGPADRPQTVVVLVRPADSTVGLADAAFYEVGDAVLRETTPTADDGKLPISATGVPALLALVFAAVLLARRRRS